MKGQPVKKPVKRDFITLLDRSSDELKELINVAIQLKIDRDGGVINNTLMGKSIGLIFEKSSTRTRVSFEVGVRELGGSPLFLSANDIQLGRGERIEDTARVLSRYLHGIMIRTYGQDRIETLAKYSDIPIINGLTDDYHPCQILADIMTFYQEFGRYSGIKVAYIGDGNNMCHSWLNGAARFGFDLSVASPKGYSPREDIVKRALSEAKQTGAKIEVLTDPVEAVKGAHVVTTDVWASMGQEDQADEKSKILRPYQINAELMAISDDSSIFLHCLPAHIGEEVTEEVFNSSRSRVFDEAENRLHVQKAVMIDTFRR